MNTQNLIAVTVPDAATLSGLSRSAIYEALKRGDLAAKKAGGRTLILVADLRAYMIGLPAYQN
jgi:excisionase family DNA binding protein